MDENNFHTQNTQQTGRHCHGTGRVQKTAKAGISFGSALAMVISYTTWHSVGWAIFHGLLSWAYVLYFLIRY